MLVAAVESAVVGAVAAVIALRLLPHRFPSPRLAALAGGVGALLGGLITGFVTGGGHPAAALLASVLVAAAGLSLLLRPPARRRPAPGPRTA